MFALRRTLSTLLFAATVGTGLIASSGAASAATGSAGPRSSGSVGCNRSSSHSATMHAPTLRAVDRTTARDSQTVAFQPVVFKWNGSAWYEYSSVAAKFGTATDVASPTTWYSAYGQSAGNGTTVTTLPGSGHWAVAYKMWWYTGNTVTGYDYQWASSYYVMSPIGAVQSVPHCTT